jgi:hypothetical protein
LHDDAAVHAYSLLDAPTEVSRRINETPNIWKVKCPAGQEAANEKGGLEASGPPFSI